VSFLSTLLCVRINLRDEQIPQRRLQTPFLHECDVSASHLLRLILMTPAWVVLDPGSCFPNLKCVYPHSDYFLILLSFTVVPTPWAIVVRLHSMNPSEVTAENVESCVEKYWYANVL
jgi:hypothetical protein